MKKSNQISLSNSEWVILESLWENAPQTVTQLSKAMKKKVGWAASTTKTLISRMEGKGYLRFENGMKAREYYPAIQRSEVAKAETENFLSRVYQGRLGLMLNAMVDQETLSLEEINELQEILTKAKEENKRE